MELVKNHSDRVGIKTNYLCNGIWEPGALAVIENPHLPFVIQVDSEGPIVESILKLFSAYIGTLSHSKKHQYKTFCFYSVNY